MRLILLALLLGVLPSTNWVGYIGSGSHVVNATWIVPPVGQYVTWAGFGGVWCPSVEQAGTSAGGGRFWWELYSPNHDTQAQVVHGIRTKVGDVVHVIIRYAGTFRFKFEDVTQGKVVSIRERERPEDVCLSSTDYVDESSFGPVSRTAFLHITGRQFRPMVLVDGQGKVQAYPTRLTHRSFTIRRNS